MWAAVRRLGTAVVVGAVLLAGCADDEGTASSTTTTSEPAPTTTTATTEPAPAIDQRAATDADGLARQLAQVETLVRDASTSPVVVGAAARLQQRVYRRLAERPELREPTLSLVNRLVRAVAEPNITAASELLALTKPRTSLPDGWRIVEPATAEELRGHYQAAEEATGVGW